MDRAPDEPDGSNRLFDSHSNVLLQRIAMVSGDRAPDADVAEVITEVFQWLENESDALNAVSATSFVNYPSFIPMHASTEPTPEIRRESPPKTQSASREIQQEKRRIGRSRDQLDEFTTGCGEGPRDVAKS